MGNGAFRDASAAIERALVLEQENEQLRSELAELAGLRIQVEELQTLREEVAELRAIARTENEGAYVKRLGEERNELADEVRVLRDRLASQEAEVARARRITQRNASVLSTYETAAARIGAFFTPKPSEPRDPK
jgi:vacuolar-type H+-ATPase subunit I/STV1